MHHVLLILFLSYILFMFLGGLFGFVKAKPFKFSDKVDLFYVEPRRRNCNVASSDVRVRPSYGESRPRPKRKLVGKRIPEKSLPVRTNIKPKIRPSSQRSLEKQPVHSIERKVFEECVAALKQLGYGTDVHCKSIVSRHINNVPGKITSCESFLESFLKLESCNESKLRSTS